MLTHLEVFSFKGFRQFALPLEPVTCLVGLNSNGKTSVLQAIQLLYDITDFAFGRRDQRGFASVRWDANPTDSLAKFTYDDPTAIWLHRKTTEPCKLSAVTNEDLRIDLEIVGPREYHLDIKIAGASVKNQIADPDVQKQVTGFLTLAPALFPPVGAVSPSEQFFRFIRLKRTWLRAVGTA